MFIAVIFYCSILNDPTSCNILIRKDHLYQEVIVCEEAIKSVAEGLLATGHYVKAKCFKFNPYGESA